VTLGEEGNVSLVQFANPVGASDPLIFEMIDFEISTSRSNAKAGRCVNAIMARRVDFDPVDTIILPDIRRGYG
jgi:hypothetical protein